jgi:hypothetical protein
MRIGNNELNENESEWATNFAENKANEACKEIISALNIKCSLQDAKGILAYLWSVKKAPEIVKEPEVFEEDEEEEEEEEE